MSPATILVTGATGKLGRHIVHRMLRDGHPVRALVAVRRRENRLALSDAPDQSAASGRTLPPTTPFRAAVEP